MLLCQKIRRQTINNKIQTGTTALCPNSDSKMLALTAAPIYSLHLLTSRPLFVTQVFSILQTLPC